MMNECNTCFLSESKHPQFSFAVSEYITHIQHTMCVPVTFGVLIRTVLPIP